MKFFIILLFTATVTVNAASYGSDESVSMTAATKQFVTSATTAMSNTTENVISTTAGGAKDLMGIAQETAKLGIDATATLKVADIEIIKSGTGAAIGVGQSGINGLANMEAKKLGAIGKLAKMTPVVGDTLEGAANYAGETLTSAATKVSDTMDEVKSKGAGALDLAADGVTAVQGQANALIDSAGNVVGAGVDKMSSTASGAITGGLTIGRKGTNKVISLLGK